MRKNYPGVLVGCAIVITCAGACTGQLDLLPATGSDASAGGGGRGVGGASLGGSGAGGSTTVSRPDAAVGIDGGGAAGLPCNIATLLSTRCGSCHGVVPASGAPMSLVTYADLIAPARSNPAVTVAVLAANRMQSTTAPMPPAPATRATPAEIAAVQAWNAAGNPPGAACANGVDAGVSDPFSVPPTCTSRTTWTGGTRGSASMNPGLACVSCHATTGGEAPLFALAGTVYPTAHEPDLCNGVNGATAGAQVVISGADGRSITLTPNAAGNFTYEGNVALPFQAKVVYMGRERVMSTPQTSGDCNSCHTQSGSNGAPGRILLP